MGETDPSWAAIAKLVPHLAPATRAPVDGPDPGTLNNSAYITFFPAGILLNDPVPAAPRV